MRIRSFLLVRLPLPPALALRPRRVACAVSDPFDPRPASAPIGMSARDAFPGASAGRGVSNRATPGVVAGARGDGPALCGAR